MSSATQWIEGAARKVVSAIGGTPPIDSDKVATDIGRLGMNARQRELNRLYSYYRGANYGARKYDLDGAEALDPLDHEAICAGSQLPAGFFDAGLQMPLRFRRPSVPYRLATQVVNRFSGLLFSDRRHPLFRSSNPDVEDYSRAIAEQGRLWHVISQAKKLGGAMGTVLVGFQFINGKVRFEVHDPRWCTPLWADRWNLDLAGITKQWMFPVQERALDERGRPSWVTRYYWYRRVINKNEDVRYKSLLVEQDREPDWDDEDNVALRVEHGLGFCPVYWVQNMALIDGEDGLPDCDGTFEMIEAVDMLLSMANRGTTSNCDPTLVLTTDDDLADNMSKGSGNAIKLPAGSSAQYLEIQGSGPKAASDLARTLRGLALEVCQCVIENPGDSGGLETRTATETLRLYESMFDKVEEQRETYGTRGLLPLMRGALLAAGKLHHQDNKAIVLPKRKVTDAESNESQYVERVPPETDDFELDLTWPPLTKPTLDEIGKAVIATGGAKGAQLIDSEAAMKFIAPYFDVEDIDGMKARLTAAAEKQKQMMQDSMYGNGDSSGGY